MMAQKYLHELLEEDQEPFLLHKYISDKRSKIKTQIYPRKSHKPLHQNSNFPTNLCKNVCLFSFPETTTTTPELRKSPLFDFQSPKAKTKSPIKFQIPSRTANLLLEAALKIQKHSSSKTKSTGFGLFGSLFKRLTQRNHKRKEIEGSELNLCVKDILKLESRKLSNGCMKEEEKLDFYNGRSSSCVWSESNEDKSLDMETWSSSSSRHCDNDCETKEIEFITNHQKDNNTHSVFCHDINRFCDSFVLQNCPFSGRHTPELSSSAAPSPSHHKTQDKESNNGGEEEKEDKEQCSPVCVLDPLFNDDEEGHGNDEDSSNLKCSYAIIERAKQQLLYKLSRFEKLAELDPLELEKRMLEDESDYETLMENNDYEAEGIETSYEENEFMQLVFEAMCHSSVHDIGQIPKDLKKLVYDLIMDEDRELDSLEEKEIMIKRVCKRVELWTEVESNTIDMMIEEDFTREDEKWKKNMEEIRDMASEIEVAIFSLVVEEFCEELVC
ncbi:hypothetical protein Lalb_Chr01g0018291 [Lupinus albus]|uniref:DUF4378 domain-containing protein n=1 Tax=Lupinus albus TaxID=3870 RepID=A0A6A4R6Y2_LUPAL|nr:hypothetical protein Lalb_Chr01g0018291 [Lupinus albus]